MKNKSNVALTSFISVALGDTHEEYGEEPEEEVINIEQGGNVHSPYTHRPASNHVISSDAAYQTSLSQSKEYDLTIATETRPNNPPLDLSKGYNSYDKDSMSSNQELVVAIAIDDDELEDGVIAEKIDLDEKKRKQNKYIKIVGPLIIIIVGVVLAEALLVTKENTQNDTSTDSSTAAPTSSRLPINKQYLESILSNTSGSDIFNDVTIAQYQALVWISEEDAEQLTTTDDRFLQRYALAVLYFATEGENWSS